MPVAEDAVSGKIVGRVHVVCLGCGSFAGSAHAALRIGHNAALEIEQTGGSQRLQRQNHRGRVAAGVGDQPRRGNLLAEELRHTIDGLSLSGHRYR